MPFRNFSPAVLLALSGLASLLQPAPCWAQATSYNISTYAGNTNGNGGFNGDGLAPQYSELNSPVAVTFDSSRNLYIADSGNDRIRKISGGKISTIAGNGTLGYAGDGGQATGAQMDSPSYVRVDASGNVYIADTANDVVRWVNPSGVINTIAGVNGSYGYFSNQEGGPAIQAYLDHPLGLAVDAAGNVYIADTLEDRVQTVSPGATTNGMFNTIAGANEYNITAGTQNWASYGGDGGPAIAAALYEPLGIVIDSAGNLYIADSDDNCIRKVNTGGIITGVAGKCGTAGGFSGDGGPATAAQLNRPFDVAVDSSGDLFIADYYNQCIRMVDASGNIHTIAGTPRISGTCSSGCPGDGGAATSAKLNYPTGIAVDTNGNIYIADSSNNVIRLLTPTGPTVNNVISASGFGAFSSVAPGSWIEIYGSNLSVDARSWAAADFQGTTAPTALDGTKVTVGGQSAYIDYISGGQVNALVPSNAPTGQQQVVVTTPTGTASYTVNVNAVEPGLLAGGAALPLWDIGGTTYVVALSTDNPPIFILPPSAIAGLTTERAQPGQTIVLYGVGFGPVNPNISAGQPGQSSSLTQPFQISIGGVQAQVSYDGMAPGFYGLYQFNVVVPNIPASDKAPVTFSLNGTPGSQTLYLAVQ